MIAGLARFVVWDPRRSLSPLTRLSPHFLPLPGVCTPGSQHAAASRLDFRHSDGAFQSDQSCWLTCGEHSDLGGCPAIIAPSEPTPFELGGGAVLVPQNAHVCCELQ